MNGASTFTEGPHLVVSYRLEQNLSNQTQSFHFDCRRTSSLSFVITAHCLNCLVVGWMVGGQDLGRFGHQASGVSESNQAASRTLVTGNPIPRRKGNLLAITGVQENGLGLQIEFVSEPSFPLVFEGLARGQQRIELLNVRFDKATDTHFATVFVPDGKLVAFENLVTKYLTEKSKKGIPLNTPLLNPIAEIRSATFEALWTDAAHMLPENDQEAVWWEFWLPARENQAAVEQRFRAVTAVLGLRTSEHVLTFPERTVINVFASRTAIVGSIHLLNEVAEIRTDVLEN